MKVVLFSIALALIVVSRSVVAGEVILNIQESGDLVVVSVINASQHPIKVRKWFTQNMAFGLIGFSVSVDGRRHIPLTGPNEDYSIASDYVTISPLQVVGGAFYISDLRKLYRVGTGCFELRAEYHDVVAEKFAAYKGTPRSNVISVCSA